MIRGSRARPASRPFGHSSFPLLFDEIFEELFVLKKVGFAAFAIAAGVTLFSGTASAAEYGHHYDGDEHQAGLLNLTNLDVAHNVNVTPGICNDNVNVLGVQVPVQHVANGLNVPLLSPGQNSGAGENPYNCAASGVSDGGTSQDN